LSKEVLSLQWDVRAVAQP